MLQDKKYKISRREAIKKLSVGGFAFSLPFEALFNNFFDERVTIRGNTGLYKNKGGTIGWYVSDGIIVAIDSQFPDTAKEFIDGLKLGQGQDVSILFNSHHHGDHSSGNIAFKGLVNKVVAHENSKTNQENTARSKGNGNEQLYPDTVFKEKWSQDLGKEKVTATYFGAAHTNGDSVIHFENANVAHVGDLVFNRRHPYIDRSAGANIEHWITVLQNIRKTYDKDTIYICGHSGEGHDVLIDYKDIQTKEMYLEKLLGFVRKQVKAGKSEEELLKATELPGISWQSEGLQRPLKAAFDELTEK